MITIPISNGLDNQTFTVSLDGEAYTISLRFNYRDQTWFCDVQDPDENYIVRGRRIVGEAGIIPALQLSTQPQGKLLTFDEGKLGHAPGRYDLGTGAPVQIIYVSVAELT